MVLPLYAEEASIHVGWVAVLTLLLPAMGGVGVWIWNRWQESRKTAITEWQDIAHKVAADLDIVQKEARESAIRFTAELSTMRQDYHSCELDRVRMQGQIAMLQSSVRRLQGLAGDEAPATTTPGVIVADAEGAIKLVSPAITSMLHWMPKDLTGKNVQMLIPERFKVAHLTGLENLKQTGRPPWTDKVIVGAALTKEGGEVPVSIALTGWQTRGGDWIISAEVSALPHAPTEKTT